MYKVIQRHQKKLLAVFGVLLMIVFIIPSTFQSAGRHAVVIGNLGKTAIHSEDEDRAKDEIEYLKRFRFYPLYNLGGQQALNSFDSHPLLYALLQKQAILDGISISDDTASRALRNGMAASELSAKDEATLLPMVRNFLLVQTLYDREAASIKVSQPLVQQVIAQPSVLFPPKLALEIGQRPRLNIAEISADQYNAQVPAPTEEQIRQQYEKYATAFPSRGGLLTTAPSTPGYKVAAKYKVQYVELPADQVIQTFLNGLSGDERYDLELVARRYYQQNQAEFHEAPDLAPATAPTTSPSTLPSTIPATAPGETIASSQPTTEPSARAAAKPTTKPFGEVSAELYQRVLIGAIPPKPAEGDEPTVPPSVVALRKRYEVFKSQVAADLRDEMLRAYAHSADTADSSATTAPVGYKSFEYLENLADAFQKAHGVRPMAHSIADWKTEQELSQLPRIGQAETPAHVDFAKLLAGSVEQPATAPTTGASILSTTGPSTSSVPATMSTTTAATSPATRPAQENVLAKWQPSPLLQDEDHNVYIFRVTGVAPEHKPSLQEVRAQIVEDLNARAAYEKARDEARKMIDAAEAIDQKTKPEQGALLQAAAAAGLRAVRTGSILGLNEVAAAAKSGPMAVLQILQQIQIPGYNPGGFAESYKLITEAAQLLARVSAKDAHPATIIDLPEEHKVLAVEIADFELPWPQNMATQTQLQIAALTREALDVRFASQWFNYDNAISRLGYKPVEKAK